MAHVFKDDKGVSFSYHGIPIAKGEVNSYTMEHKFGNNEAVGATEVTLWTGTSSLYTYPGSCMPMKVTSTLSADGAGNTGANVVTVAGLDENYNLQQETVVLSGQNPITTVNCYCRIFRAQVNSAGTGESNAGEIWVGGGTVTAGVPADKFGHIAVGQNQSLMALWTVPESHSAYLLSLSASSSKNKGVNYKLFARPFGEVFQVKLHQHLFQETSDIHFPVPRKFAAKTDLEIRAVSDGINTEVSAEMDIVVIAE